MKVLKFKSNLISLVLDGSKNCTWRLFDEKDLSEGDAIMLVESGKRRGFAKAKIYKVLEKRFKDLNEDDKVGHERFSSDAEMYATYSDYYRRKISPNTTVKIIWFDHLEQL